MKMRCTAPLCWFSIKSLVVLVATNSGVVYGWLEHDIPVPVDVTVTRVATDIEHNGQRLTIDALSTDLTIDSVLSFYRNLWGKNDEDELGYTEQRLGSWSVIAEIGDRQQTVVQVRNESGQTKGYLSVMSLDVATKTPPTTNLPPISSAIQHSSTYSEDIGTHATTQVFELDLNFEAAASQLRREFDESGWSLISELSDSSFGLLMFGREADRLEVVLSEAGGRTGMVVNVVETVP